jgi:hypothetical protein
MSAIKSIFTGPPKPRTDKDAERRMAEQLANEKKRSEATDRVLASSRRARLAGGARRGIGLAYVSPTASPLGGNASSPDEKLG